MSRNLHKAGAESGKRPQLVSAGGGGGELAKDEQQTLGERLFPRTFIGL